MREIKFKAWDSDLKRMTPHGEINIDYCIANHNCENCDEDANHVTLLQYTGLKDKHGVEIYEGDIVNFIFVTRSERFIHTGKILMDDFMWCVETNGGEMFSINRISNVEVIDNIHQNPELLNN